jgi:hypothetical protein
MIVGAITFDLGFGTPASNAAGDGVTLSLSDASGLAPLTLPEAFLRGQGQQPASPSSDAVRRFEDAMSAGPKLTSYVAASLVSRGNSAAAADSSRDVETRRVDGTVVVERPIVVSDNPVNPVQDKPDAQEMVQLVDSRRDAYPPAEGCPRSGCPSRGETQRVDGPVVVERPTIEREVQGVVVEKPVTVKTVVLENPVNLVNPVQKEELPIQGGVQVVDLRRGAQTQRVVGPVVVERSVVEREVPGVVVETPAPEKIVVSENPVQKEELPIQGEEQVVDSRRGAETQRVDRAVVVEKTVVEREVQGVVVEETVAVKTVVPNNPVNPVNPVQKEAQPAQEVVQVVDSRRGAETQRVDGAVVVEKTVVEREVQGVVVENPVAAKTVVSENLVNPVNPVQDKPAQEVVQVVDSRGGAETQRVEGAVVVERLAVEREVQGVVVEKPVAEKTVVPNSPVNLVNPVQDKPVQEVVQVVDSRGGAETQRVEGTVVVERPAVEREVQGVVAEKPVAEKTVVPNNPVNLVNSVQEEAQPVQGEVQVVDSRGGAETRRIDRAEGEKAVAASQHVVVAPAVAEAPAPQAVQVSPEVAAASAESARTEAIVETVNKVVEAVAGQILVTRGDVYGEGEVKITLKPTVLDGSEITMTSKDGTLTVCVTPATQAASAAASAALPRLEIALAEHLPAFHHVAVTLAVKKGSRNEAV